MRTPAQRRNLLILRDEILPGIEKGELDMRRLFNRRGTPLCLLGHAAASGRIKKLRHVNDADEVFGLYKSGHWVHIFGGNLPNDPTWLAANITDLLCAEE